MKKILGVVALAGVLALTGCNPYSGGGADEERQTEGQRAGDLYEQKVTLSDGRTVTCIVYEDYRKGGLSCDWEDPNSGDFQ